MYTQGDIWLANLEPAKFGEVGKVRPIVIVQEDTFDLIELKSTIIVPISSTPQGEDFTLLRIKINSPETGLEKPSTILVEKLRSVSISRLKVRIGRVSEAELAQLQKSIRNILGL